MIYKIVSVNPGATLMQGQVKIPASTKVPIFVSKIIERELPQFEISLEALVRHQSETDDIELYDQLSKLTWSVSPDYKRFTLSPSYQLHLLLNGLDGVAAEDIRSLSEQKLTAFREKLASEWYRYSFFITDRPIKSNLIRKDNALDGSLIELAASNRVYIARHLFHLRFLRFGKPYGIKKFQLFCI